MAEETFMKLIGFVGKRRSGKDTAAQVLIAQGFQPAKFAGALKCMIRSYLEYIGYPDPEYLIEGEGKELPTAAFCGREPRWAMQSLGTEWGRNLIGEKLWVNACLDRCNNLMRMVNDVVVSDVRFPNEVAGLQGIGGKIIRIVRPGTETDTHESERLIDTLDADFEIENKGTIDELHAKVLHLVNQHE